jgi:hypothetical protein
MCLFHKRMGTRPLIEYIYIYIHTHARTRANIFFFQLGYITVNKNELTKEKNISLPMECHVCSANIISTTDISAINSYQGRWNLQSRMN